MADNEIEEEVPETPAVPGVTYYLLRNEIRGRTNRTARAMQVGRRTFVQRLAGGNIIVRRSRPARISEAVLLANLPEILKAVSEHRLVVTTTSGVLVDPVTLSKVGAPEVSKPLPNPPLDSAKNDKNQGVGYDIPPTPEGTVVSSEEPELLRSSKVDFSVTEEPALPAEEVPALIAPAVVEEPSRSEGKKGRKRGDQ